MNLHRSAHLESVSAYFSDHGPLLTQLDSALVQAGQTEAQLNSLVGRAQRVRPLLQTWLGGPRTLFLGKFLFKPGIEDHFRGRVDLRYFDIEQVLNLPLETLAGELAGAVVLLNNNELMRSDALQLLQHLYLACPDTIFITWLFDNHHMANHGAMIGLCSDLIYPAHCDNIQVLNRFCPYVRGPLTAPTIAWSISAVRDLVTAGLFDLNRPVRLSGGYYHYQPFVFRNTILGRNMKPEHDWAIRFMNHDEDNAYWKRTPEHQWNEWLKSKSNLVVPTLNDLPIRFFDALLTGNVPLLPRSLQYLVEALPGEPLNAEDVVWFDYADLTDLKPLVDLACARFESGAVQGIERRHRWAIRNHMVEHRIDRVLDDLAVLAAASSPSS